MRYDVAINRTITQRELRNQSAAVLREVEAGRTIVVTRNGTPVAELRPIQPRRFVLRATLADAAAPLLGIPHSEWAAAKRKERIVKKALRSDIETAADFAGCSTRTIRRLIASYRIDPSPLAVRRLAKAAGMRPVARNTVELRIG
jgi:prevent-host-death family protein